jgi:hypothetical protein
VIHLPDGVAGNNNLPPHRSLINKDCSWYAWMETGEQHELVQESDELDSNAA